MTIIKDTHLTIKELMPLLTMDTFTVILKADVIDEYFPHDIDDYSISELMERCIYNGYISFLTNSHIKAMQACYMTIVDNALVIVVF